MTLDAAFYPALASLAAALAVPADWLLLVFYLETRLDPSAHRAGSDYWGLSQMSGSNVQKYAHVAGSTFRAWPASLQLTAIGPWYQDTVKAYLPHPPPRSPGVLYALNLLPGRVAQRGDGPDTVLASQGEAAYAANRPLDLDGNGTITIADLDAFMGHLAQESAFQHARASLGTNGGGSARATPASVGILALGTVAVGSLLGERWFQEHHRRNRPTRKGRP